MTTINELKSLQSNILNFYVDFTKKKRVNKKDLMNLYFKDKLAESILLTNLRSEYNNLEKGYRFLLQTLSYQNKRDIVKSIKLIKKEYPEIYNGTMVGFKILIRMRSDVEKLLNILNRETAYVDNKQKLESIYKNEEIPLLIKINEKNKIWNNEYNLIASKLKRNRNLLNLKSETGGATAGSIGMIISMASALIAYHLITKPGIDFGSDFLFILETMTKDGLLFGIITIIAFALSVSSFKKG